MADPKPEVYTKPPQAGKVLSKEEAGYVEEGPFGCLHCQWYRQPMEGEVGQCEPVGGSVLRYACCDYWNDPDAPKGIGKRGVEYVYVPYSHYTCEQCIFFDAKKETCWPVEGHISPKASCNKWMPLRQV